MNILTIHRIELILLNEENSHHLTLKNANIKTKCEDKLND